MNTVSLLPAVAAYCEERIKELREGNLMTCWVERTDELKRIITLCEGLEKTQFTLTNMLNQNQQSDPTVLTGKSFDGGRLI